MTLKIDVEYALETKTKFILKKLNVKKIIGNANYNKTTKITNFFVFNQMFCFIFEISRVVKIARYFLSFLIISIMFV